MYVSGGDGDMARTLSLRVSEEVEIRKRNERAGRLDVEDLVRNGTSETLFREKDQLAFALGAVSKQHDTTTFLVGEV